MRLLLTHYLKYFQWAAASCRSFVLDDSRAGRTVITTASMSQRKALEQSRKLCNCTMPLMGRFPATRRRCWAAADFSQQHHQLSGAHAERWQPAVGRVKTHHHRMCNCILRLRRQVWHEVRRTAACTFCRVMRKVAEKRRNEWQILARRMMPQPELRNTLT